MITPFKEKKQLFEGMSYGLSSAGYDIRVAQDVRLLPENFFLGSTVEKFDFPYDVLGVVHDKSSLARRGLSVFNTVIEPGWRGTLTLELRNQGHEIINLKAGSPIAQIVFHRLEAPTVIPYDGKYQDQVEGPVPAIMEQSACMDTPKNSRESNVGATIMSSSQFSLSLEQAKGSNPSPDGEKTNRLKGELVFFNRRP